MIPSSAARPTWNGWDERHGERREVKDTTAESPSAEKREGIRAPEIGNHKQTCHYVRAVGQDQANLISAKFRNVSHETQIKLPVRQRHTVIEPAVIAERRAFVRSLRTEK